MVVTFLKIKFSYCWLSELRWLYMFMYNFMSLLLTSECAKCNEQVIANDAKCSNVHSLHLSVVNVSR